MQTAVGVKQLDVTSHVMVLAASAIWSGRQLQSTHTSNILHN